MNDRPVHVIVLTRNRPHIMQRCVQQINLGSEDRITIIDDSASTAFFEDRRLLSAMPIMCRWDHFSADQLFASLKSRLPNEALEWTKRRANRDIAPLRNLSLLISISTSSPLTILIDDDITEFDIAMTRQRVAQLTEEHGAVIAGAHIMGIDERGPIERLENALGALEARKGLLDEEDLRTVFCVPAIEPMPSPEPVEWVSGGYLAFRLPTESVFAFPPGYNEDCLWCMDNVRQRIAKVFRLPQVVCHDPPRIRNVTEEGLFFELLGDLLVDLAEESCTALGKYIDECALTTLFISKIINHNPTIEIQQLLERSRSCSNSEILGPAGLASLQHLFGNGKPSIDWETKVTQWQQHAEKNRRSFRLATNIEKTDLLQIIYIGRG